MFSRLQNFSDEFQTWLDNLRFLDRKLVLIWRFGLILYAHNEPFNDPF